LRSKKKRAKPGREDFGVLSGRGEGEVFHARRGWRGKAKLVYYKRKERGFILTMQNGGRGEGEEEL